MRWRHQRVPSLIDRVTPKTKFEFSYIFSLANTLAWSVAKTTPLGFPAFVHVVAAEVMAALFVVKHVVLVERQLVKMSCPCCQRVHFFFPEY